MDALLHGKSTAVQIRTLGEQDIVFWESMRHQAGDWISDLLSHCVRVADGQPQAPLFFEDLVISERNDLLLLIAQGSFGNEHYVTVPCPRCAEKMDIDYTLEELRPGSAPLPQIKIGNKSYSTIEPTGKQQRQWDLDQENWQDDILRYCLGNSAYLDLVKEEKAVVLESLLNSQPGTRLELEVNCISCQTPLYIPISMAAFFSRSMSNTIEAVEEEVHLLASSYHWSEAEILALPALRRKRYVERVSGQWM